MYYVLLDAEGYIVAWSLSEQQGFQEIEAKAEDVNKLDFVRIVDGKAQVDEERRQQVIKAFEESSLTDVEKLTQENELLKAQGIELRDSILDLAIIIDSLGGELE
ncbi:hypothetical protein HB904_09540 [Listeria booriae]|uniref:Uncharacterized protein n=2 Tax=Listeria booriae TaxID=1552123 RepID=A0A842AL31_9LIST|nr:hypothetical protein [Listeria booriae]